MIVTTKAPQSLWNLYHVYKDANPQGKAFITIRDCLMHNNEPVNILKVMTILKDVNILVDIGWVNPLEYELSLRYLSEVSGYSPVELSDRLIA